MVYLFLFEAKSVFFPAGCDGCMMFKPNEEMVISVLKAATVFGGIFQCVVRLSCHIHATYITYKDNET